MAKAKVLIDGYAKQTKNGWLASSTTTLVEINGKIIIVDPGCNRELLLEKLSENYLKPSDVDFVQLTHPHTDHALLAAIFVNAKVLNDREIYDNDKQIAHHGRIPETDLEVVSTPGHSNDSCSLVARVNNAVYVVVGDLFWWMDTEEQKTDTKSLLDHKDPYVKDDATLKQNRQKILKLADYIIPGHGKMFKVER